MAAPGRFDISVLGDKALEVALRQLPAKVEQRLVNRSLREAFKPTLEVAKQLVPVGVGALRRTLKLRKGRGGRNLAQFRIFTGGLADLAAQGARRTRRVGKRGAKREGFYPAAVELGHQRRTKQGPRRVAPRSFLRVALHQTRDTALMIVAEDLAAGVKEYAASQPGGSAK